MSLCGLLCSLFRHGPNLMLYPGAFDPRPRVLLLPSEWGLPYEDVTLTTSDSVKIRAYLLLQPERQRKNSNDFVEQNENRPTVIMFHGNSDNIGYTIPLASVFYRKMRCNVLMLSPRGYGLSDGRPSTKGFRRDCSAALDYVLAHSRLQTSPVILYGQSMGAALAIDLASRRPNQISALIVENTFTSLRRLIPDVLPIFSFCAPFFRQWNSLESIAKLPSAMALLMLSGQSDEVIPPAHMKQLWDAANPPSRKGALERVGKIVEFQDGTHNDTWDQPGYWEAIIDFVTNLPYDSCV